MPIQINEDLASESPISSRSENIFSVIRNRRATRGYLPKQITEETVRLLLDYAIQAPSAMNLQPWSFVVIQNHKLLDEISDKAKKIISSNPHFSKERRENRHLFFTDPDFDIFYGAPTLIVICAKEIEQKEFHPESDCYLAAQNLMLAATGMGLATCPIGLAIDELSTPDMKTRLGIPSGFRPVLPIVVGYASSETEPVNRNPPIIKWVK